MDLCSQFTIYPGTVLSISRHCPHASRDHAASPQSAAHRSFAKRPQPHVYAPSQSHCAAKPPGAREQLNVAFVAVAAMRAVAALQQL